MTPEQRAADDEAYRAYVRMRHSEHAGSCERCQARADVARAARTLVERAVTRANDVSIENDDWNALVRALRESDS